MFHFPGCPLPGLWIQPGVTGHYPSRVPPFGDLRITAHLRLPEAFRSLSRPSSAISALASTLRSCSLDLCSCSPSGTRTNASSSQTICLLRLVGTDCSLSLFCLFLCSFQGALKNLRIPLAVSRFDSILLPILQNDTDNANHTSDSGSAAISDLQNHAIFHRRRFMTGSPCRSGSALRFAFRSSSLPQTLRPWDAPSILSPALLPRKEVIQPHLPIRLPCYDFTPVIDLTFGGGLLLRLPYRLRVLSTPMV